MCSCRKKTSSFVEIWSNDAQCFCYCDVWPREARLLMSSRPAEVTEERGAEENLQAALP